MFAGERKTEVGWWLNPPERGPTYPPASVLDPPSSLPCPLPVRWLSPLSASPLLTAQADPDQQEPAEETPGEPGHHPANSWSVWVWEKEGSAHRTACWCWAEQDWLSQSKQGEKLGPQVRKGSSLLQAQNGTHSHPNPLCYPFPPNF